MSIVIQSSLSCITWFQYTQFCHRHINEQILQWNHICCGILFIISLWWHYCTSKTIYRILLTPTRVLVFPENCSEQSRTFQWSYNIKCKLMYFYISIKSAHNRVWILNEILMFSRHHFAIRQPLHRHDSQFLNLSTALPARGCHALQRVICWELSSTCIVKSWSQRRRQKHDNLTDRWGSTCHVYGRQFVI